MIRLIEPQIELKRVMIKINQQQNFKLMRIFTEHSEHQFKLIRTTSKLNECQSKLIRLVIKPKWASIQGNQN